ncbi:hypothetical protein B0J12DRAFT_705845 [Macrophomina phaseolina]|uniref:Uncharacterized protein n=1 Tax=Macrophomina phaseolina TaxID=35725 RepID=A0ABQ8FQW8_9PEZI|nr:hypothetical protein B0J12DRAFT_705845 [Macrophomina phaseolina]
MSTSSTHKSKKHIFVPQLDSDKCLARTLLERFPEATTVHEALGLFHRDYPDRLSDEDAEQVHSRIIDLAENGLGPDIRNQVLAVFALTAVSINSQSVFYIPISYFSGITDGNGIFYFDNGFIRVYSQLREYIADRWSRDDYKAAVITEFLQYLAEASKDGFTDVRWLKQPLSHDIVMEIINKRSTGMITEREYSRFLEAAEAFQEIRVDKAGAHLKGVLEQSKVLLRPVLRARWVKCPSCMHLVYVPPDVVS